MSMMYGTTVSGPGGLLVWQEFIASTGIDPDRLRELLALGWLEARRSEAEEILFRDVDIYRVRKLERKVKALHDMDD